MNTIIRRDAARVFPYPKIRRWLSASYRLVAHKPMIHGLVEVDVTAARATLRERKARTGEALSFTAFIVGCVAKAVDEHKVVQGLRLGRRRFIVFDDVDVYVPVEHELAGMLDHRQIVPHIVRAANHKTLREIHREIRAAQTTSVEKMLRGPRFLPPALFGLSVWLILKGGRWYPQILKRSVGTVGVTAVGMFGKGAGWGIPTPPPTPLMVTVGGIGERVALIGGQPATREYLCLTISADHNIVDGAPAARFTERLRELIESGYGLDEVASAPEPVAVGAGGM